jgi:hypothetical protein
MPCYWQIAAGDEDRNYASYFLDHGIAFVGGKKNVERILSLQIGDRLLLKRGTTMLIAVGEVVERVGRVSGDARDGEPGRQWLLDFYGWELPGWCHVEWRKLPEELPFSGLRRGTILRFEKPELRGLTEQLLAELPQHERAADEPSDTRPVGDEELLRRLIENGLRVGAAEELTTQLRRIRRLADYYYNLDDWSAVKEHETRTFLVVPLLLALGWAEQQLKIELGCSGGSVDIACFRDPFISTAASGCIMLIETKGLSRGLNLARDQAERYARDFPACNLLLVTNGVHYEAYARIDKERFTAAPVAHLNLRKPTLRYPLNPSAIAGALEAIELLLPSVAARQRPMGLAEARAAA